MFNKNTIEIRSSLSPKAWKARLAEKADIEQRTFPGFAGSKPVLYQLRGDTLRLRVRPPYRNDFAPFFYGKVSSDGSGTMVSGHLAMRPFLRTFLILCLCLFAFLQLLLLRTQFEAQPLWPPFLIVVMIVLVTCGRGFSRTDKARLVELLEEVSK